MLFALITGVLCTPVICHAKEEEELTPIYGENVEDGSYLIEVESSSSMFRIVKAELQVENGEMEATLTLSGKGYLKLFMGTGEEALEADEDEFIPFIQDEEGAYTYTVPVEVLNQEIDCAAYSKRKEKWYDRQLVFLASSLPGDIVLSEFSNVDLEPIDMKVQDGMYTMEVSLSGGSGKATITSPAQITVSEKQAVAKLEWSSPSYDYMIMNGKKYLPVNTEGNSVFEIPILVLDEEIDIVADTVAMSQPHEISYTIVFHSDTLQKDGNTNITIILVCLIFLTAVITIVVLFYKTRKK